MKTNATRRGIVTTLIAVLLTNAMTMTVVSAIVSSDYVGLTNFSRVSSGTVEGARRQAVRVQRRYWKAVDVYHELQIMGVQNLMDPDIGDASTYEPYLVPEYVQSLIDASHGAAPEEGLSYNELPEVDRDLLDGYMLTGRCPATLKRSRYVSGFYELCQSMLEKKLQVEAETRISRSTVKTYTNLDVLKKRIDLLRTYYDRNALHTEDYRRPSLRGLDRLRIEQENYEPYRQY